MIFKKVEKVVGLQQPAGRDYVQSKEYSSKLLNQVSKVREIPHTQCDSLKIDAKTSSNQNSILKKGSGRTFLFQTENLFFNIDFQYQELQKLGLKIYR